MDIVTGISGFNEMIRVGKRFRAAARFARAHYS